MSAHLSWGWWRTRTSSWGAPRRGWGSCRPQKTCARAAASRRPCWASAAASRPLEPWATLARPPARRPCMLMFACLLSTNLHTPSGNGTLATQLQNIGPAIRIFWVLRGSSAMLLLANIPHLHIHIISHHRSMSVPGSWGSYQVWPELVPPIVLRTCWSFRPKLSRNPWEARAGGWRAARVCVAGALLRVVRRGLQGAARRAGRLHLVVHLARAVHVAVALEACARMAAGTVCVNHAALKCACRGRALTAHMTGDLDMEAGHSVS